MPSYKIWECVVCGWVYDESKGLPDEGIAPGTRWDDVPDDWKCPECMVGKADFEMLEVITAEEPEAAVTDEPYKLWECIVCGWLYDEAKGYPEDGIAPGTRWQDVPEDWKCPECMVGKADFEMMEVTQSEVTVSAPPSVEPFKVWECIVCGWLYDEAKGYPEDGIAPGTRWEDVPEDWKCPECMVGKADFEMMEVSAETVTESEPAEAKHSYSYQQEQAPIVIIGSGLAGYGLVKELRRHDQQVPITLITSDSGDYYSKPMLSTAFAKNKSAQKLVTSTAEEMAQQYDLSCLIHTSVSEIDTSAKEIVLQGSEQRIAYSKLVLATGSECIPAPVSGDARGLVYSVNDLQGYAAFRAAMVGRKKVLVLGAGLIGVEYANDLISSGYEVDVIDPMEGALTSLLPGEAGSAVSSALEDKGVKFHFGTVVESVEREGQGVRATLKNGEQIMADLVLSGIGVRPRINLAIASGLETNRGIVVDRQLQTSAVDVYALGDCAEVDGHVLYYIAPMMDCIRELAKSLTGAAAGVCYGAMPVAVKTTLCPVVVSSPSRETVGEWVIDSSDGFSVKARYLDAAGTLLGFALTGDAVKGQDELVSQVVPLMR